MIVEDGGYAFPRLHDDPALQPYLACCLGAVEHTTRGRLNYEFRELDGPPRTPRGLKRPAVTIASSRLKTTHEGGFVAQCLLDECGWLLRRDHQFLRHQLVTVVGYGRVGAPLVRALSSQDADVMVVDPEHTPTTLNEAIRRGAFLVFGATGTPSMTVEDLAVWLREGRQDTLSLASASSKSLEFTHVTEFFRRARADPGLLRRVSGRDGVVTCRPDPHVGIRYSVGFADGTAKTCVLLADGYPVIFFPPDTHGAPNRVMDPVMTQLFLAACGLAHAHDALDARVYTVDDLRSLAPLGVPAAWAALMDEEGLLTQWCALNQIDPASYLRRIGSWPCTEPALPGPPDRRYA
ncbi:MAG: NAD(P)-dependent oxidoreductase [Egibacteraceae bacterium]